MKPNFTSYHEEWSDTVLFDERVQTAMESVDSLVHWLVFHSLCWFDGSRFDSVDEVERRSLRFVEIPIVSLRGAFDIEQITNSIQRTYLSRD